MRALQRDLRSKRESLMKLIDQQREEFAFNSRPLRNASNKIETVNKRISGLIKPLKSIIFAILFLRTKAFVTSPTTIIKKYRRLGMLLKEGFQLVVRKKKTLISNDSKNHR